MKGFGSGLIWGGVVGALGLVIASESAPLPEMSAASPGTEAATPAPAPVTEAPVQPATPEPAAPEPATLAPAAAAPAVEPAAPAAAAPGAAAPEPDPAAPAPAPADPAAPAGQDSSAAEPATAPVLGSVEVPEGSEFAKPLPETDPAVPAAAAAPGKDAPPEVAAPAAAPATPETDTAAPVAPASETNAPTQPQVQVAEGSAPAATEGDAAPAAGAAPAAPGAPVAEAAPAVSEPPPAVASDAARDEPSILVTDAPQLPGEETSENAEMALAAVPGDRPETGFDGAVDGVTTDRLPRIGDVPAAAEPAEIDPADLPPIERFARPFDNAEGKPSFAILLIDRGQPDLDRAALAALPFPVTFVLDPAQPGVADRAAVYRAAGQEVVMLATGIPQGATASDLEVSFAANATALPEAVAVLDLAEAGFQDDRPMATMVVPILKAQGRGLLTYDSGLNPAGQVASREELRSATIFRRLDAEGEPVAAIRRYLDRAAFKAAQEGRVAVIGETRPETVAALMEWTIEGRASGVALAPVTAVLRAE